MKSHFARTTLIVLALTACSTRVHAGEIRLERYYALDDPREAATRLLAETRGMDQDDPHESPPRSSVILGSGSKRIDVTDKRLFEKASSLVSQEHGDKELVCVIKLPVAPTIRMTADLMNRGIRIYRGTPWYALFVRATAGMITELERSGSVEWMGELTADDKYPPDRPWEPGTPLAVLTLVGDRPECRADLTRLGGEVLGVGITGIYGYHYDFYDVRIELSRIHDVASLWWVQEIQQPMAGFGLE